MRVVHLTDRSILSVSGADARDFLQNLVTTDLAALGEAEAKPGALLTPQGKILFDFLVSSAGANSFRLECRADIIDDFVRRLMIYRLRAKVEIVKVDQPVIAIRFGSDPTFSETDSSTSRDDSTAGLWLRDTRFRLPSVAERSYDAAAATAAVEEWTAFRIANGVAESGDDYSLADAFPHDVLLDQTGGVGLRKGCYVGQEVVTRMHHRGTARRRVLVVSAEADLPPAGADISADGRSVGTLGTTLARTGLAIARIDKVKAAMDAGVPLVAAGVTLGLAIPPGVGFAFPEAAAIADDA
ncbi:MAG: folate-binding protein YgfZ [Rhizobiaceae bacterium]